MRRSGLHIRRVVLALLVVIMWPALSIAQDKPRENIQIGLSTDKIGITSDFSGTELTIFGALENPDPEVFRTGRYDIIVVLEGPYQSVTVRKKERFLGLWINRDARSFINVPASYSMAATRALQDVTTDTGYKQLALGPNYLAYNNAVNGQKSQNDFTTALREIKDKEGLFSIRVGGVQFLSQNLFRATVNLPASVPVGTHRARAYLFRNGIFVDEVSSQLVIVKSGLEAWISNLAKNHGLVYGLLAVAIAVVTGWLGRVLFKRD